MSTDVTLRSRGRRYKCSIAIDESGSKIIFKKSPFKFKNEIRAMAGARWNNEARVWTVKNNPRNNFQLNCMMVEPTNPNPYEWFERPLELLPRGDRPLSDVQLDIISKAVQYRYQIFAAEMGLGKSLASIEIAERLKAIYGWDDDEDEDKIWFVGPRSALESVYFECAKWDSKVNFGYKSYNALTSDTKFSPEVFPQFLILDESTSVKTPGAQRTVQAMKTADKIREKYGTDGGVILLSGSPTAKAPSDLWAQAEIAYPGFLREGSFKAFEERYAIVTMQEDLDGVKFPVREGWRDEEVERIPARLEGLMSVYRMSDSNPLPPRTFKRVELKPSSRIVRIGKALVDKAPNTITALTWLRQLSSGFQYEGEPGEERTVIETKCPKDEVLRDTLAEEDFRGRMICFAGFQGSIDRVKKICQSEGWDTIVVDGRGWVCYDKNDQLVKEHVLNFWANNPNKTVFIGNPGSCKYGLTLVEAKTVLVFDQDFSAEARIQSLARNYRRGQTEPVRVIDLAHLPVDTLVLDTLQENRRLETLSLGLISSTFEDCDAEEKED